MTTKTTARKKRIQQMRKKRRLHTLWLMAVLILVLAGIAGCLLLIQARGASNLPRLYSLEDELPSVGNNIGTLREKGFAAELCVGDDNVSLDNLSLNENQRAALFRLEDGTVMFAQDMYDRVYPASITKIMTGMLALEYGNLDDIVTISQSAVTLEEGSQVCGFQAGDKVSLDKLVHCLLVYSGNDAAAAIAEYIGGTEEEFVNMMNQEAQKLGMTGTHFTNPHGLQDENHYTTVYDIYLMLNQAMESSEFLSIVELGSYTVEYESSDGTERATALESTDHYLIGDATAPKGVTVLGGKTGTTSMAGNCLALISQNAYGLPYISIVTNAATKEGLYQQMNQLLSHIN